MNNYIKTYLILDENFTNLNVLSKMISLILRKNIELTRVSNNVIKVPEIEKDNFCKIIVSLKTIQNDLSLKQLALVEVPYYSEDLLDILKINKSGFLTLYEILMDLYLKHQLKNSFILNIFSKSPSILIDTVRTYIDLEESIINTSEIMFTHRNTINYRIGRFTQLTNIDLKNKRNVVLIRFLIFVYDKINQSGELK